MVKLVLVLLITFAVSDSFDKELLLDDSFENRYDKGKRIIKQHK